MSQTSCRLSTALMANFWYPIAYPTKKARRGIHTVSGSDSRVALPSGEIRRGGGGCPGLVGLHVFRVERETELLLQTVRKNLFGLAALAVPMLMTSAHENSFCSSPPSFRVLLMAQPLRSAHEAFHPGSPARPVIEPLQSLRCALRVGWRNFQRARSRSEMALAYSIA